MVIDMNILKQIGKKIMTEYKVVIIVLVLGIVLAVASPAFLTSRNILNVLRQVCVNAIAASAFVLVIGMGGIDLSIGSVVGLVGVITAMALKAGIPIPLVVVIALISGGVLGMVNAFFITRFNLLPFVVTLATQQIYRGIIYLLTDMSPITNLPEKFLFVGQGYVGMIPFPIFIMIGMVIIMWFVANRSKFGRYTLAIGGNEEATRVSGVNVRRNKAGVYVLMGVVAALASLVLTARTASAQITAGTNMEMDIIAGCVIGGTPMTGGICNVFGSIVGCLMVGLVSNGLNLLGVNANWQTVMKGVLILAAVLVDVISSTLYTTGRKSLQ